MTSMIVNDSFLSLNLARHVFFLCQEHHQIRRFQTNFWVSFFFFSLSLSLFKIQLALFLMRICLFCKWSFWKKNSSDLSVKISDFPQESRSIYREMLLSDRDGSCRCWWQRAWLVTWYSHVMTWIWSCSYFPFWGLIRFRVIACQT